VIRMLVNLTKEEIEDYLLDTQGDITYDKEHYGKADEKKEKLVENLQACLKGEAGLSEDEIKHLYMSNRSSRNCVICDSAMRKLKVMSDDRPRPVLIKNPHEHVHGCGHPIKPVIMDDNVLSIINYEEWREEHDKAEVDECKCFQCWMDEQ